MDMTRLGDSTRPRRITAADYSYHCPEYVIWYEEGAPRVRRNRSRLALGILLALMAAVL